MPLIEAHNIHKTYRLGRVRVPVLHGASISIEQGETVAILGASGSGKSTLLHLLGGLDTPDKASSPDRPSSIRFRDAPLAGDRYRARDVGFVFQFYHLLPELSVLDNVRLGAMVGRSRLEYLSIAGETDRRATELLTRVGLAERLRHRPAELSGGERQRVAIARALVTEPALLLADEPTGNLDRAAGDDVLDLLDELKAERELTMVLVTHSERVANRADRTVWLVDGTVRERPQQAPIAP
ncbi:MAG: ABC transporter ATP-binding protein [Planctomycetota bacterium]